MVAGMIHAESDLEWALFMTTVQRLQRAADGNITSTQYGYQSNGRVAGLWDHRGGYDPSNSTWPGSNISSRISAIFMHPRSTPSDFYRPVVPVAPRLPYKLSSASPRRRVGATNVSMIRVSPKTLVLGVLLSFLPLIGCTTNIGYREPYRQIVGRDVYLPKALELWLPVSSNIKYSSYPYEIVGTSIQPYGQPSCLAHVLQGYVIAALPAGTPFHVEKVKNYNGFDDVHDDALGTIYVPLLGRSFPCRFNLDYGSLWTSLPSQTH
jgi:hypothetical protein